MKIARKEGNYQINIGTSSGMARGLFNITDQSNDDSLVATARMRVSDWFDIEEKERLVSLPKEEFIVECENFLS